MIQNFIERYQHTSVLKPFCFKLKEELQTVRMCKMYILKFQYEKFWSWILVWDLISWGYLVLVLVVKTPNMSSL